ncbi:GMC family oxidoreductase [Lysobacter sp. GX 14042]|uniref:GMC oxidoreductase n=1 Tax=Lysobacter sp. GX 14042 TaxID=2907155 RepID=UPI001F3748D6|nr:GMC family oxidoreductase [Lysobacter sp. GX 14042]MCE7032686.1 GMC family oxidoreductase [Lysobacter sp. GX 14042]
MIIDFRSGACPPRMEADLCIIGAGVAGLAIAREFIGTPLQVCVVESGGLQGTRRDQALYEGDSIGSPELDPASCRMRAFGGSCNLWGGGCVPLDGVSPRDWVPHSGWPLSHAELVPYYRRALSFCGLEGHEPGENGFLSRPATPLLPLDPEVLVNHVTADSPVLPGEAYRQELERAGNVRVLLHANLLELEAEADGTSIRAARLGTLDGHGARVHARQYVLACGGIENARLLLLSDSVVPGGLGNRHDLVGRYFMDHPSGRLGTIRTRTPEAICLATGAPPTTRPGPAAAEICLSPRIQHQQRILGARVRPFMVEEAVPRGIQALRQLRATLRPAGRDESSALRQRLSTRRNGEPGPASTAPAPRGQLPILAIRTVLGIGDIGAAAIRRASGRPSVASNRVDLVGFFEQAPNPDSRVLLGRQLDALGQRKVCIDWRLDELDRRTHRIAARLFGDELARICGGSFVMEPWLEADHVGSLPLTGTAHHLGTTRMADDPRQGVVDRDCRVHGIDNLHIAGSSVFPTGGWAFPTFAIIAMALRLADRLHGQLAASPLSAARECANA